MKLARLVAAAVVTVVLGLAIAGVGTGEAPSKFPAPSGAALAASRSAIAHGNASVKEGEELFESQHCDSCHALAATGAKGKLGPRMDAQHDPVGEIAENIAEPRKDIVPGFEAKLMPTDYAKRMTPAQIHALARFIEAASMTKP